MLRTWLRRLANPKSRASGRRRPTLPGKLPRRLQLEFLEERLAPALHIWTGAIDNLWSKPGNWGFLQGAPTPGDLTQELRFPAGAQHSSNLNDIQNLTVQTIVLSGTGYVLDGAPLVQLNDAATITNTGTNNAIK